MFLAPPNTKRSFYQVIYFVGKKRTKKSTKTSDLKEAEKFLNSFIPADYLSGRKKSATKEFPEPTIILLSSFFEEYKTYVSNTYSVKYLKKAVIPSFTSLQTKIPDMPLENISTKMIDQFISSVFSKSKYAASLYYRTLKAAFNKAVVWNYLEVNPFNKIKTPKTPSSLPIFISEAELIKILAKVENQLYKDIFTTAFYTGMRLGELLNMKWDWIDFKQNIITIKNSDQFISKNKRERVIPIHQNVKTIFQSRFPIGKQKENNFVFNRILGIKLNSEFISKQFKKAVIEAELNPKIHFHTLRHFFASALVQRAVSLYTVKELLGHENIKTTQIYSHLQKQNLMEAVNLL